MSERFI